MTSVAEEWKARAELDPTIDPSPCAPPSAAEKEVLLTGATGFLGAFLLEELLRKTDARVHCLVRAPSPEAATERLRATLEKFQIAVDDESRSRVVALAGDLGKPKLGLDPITFEALGAEMDSIVHCGASVAFAQGYRQLESANVGGTLELLRIATDRRLKPMNYVSTIAVATGKFSPNPVLESDSIDGNISALKSGYAQSKWVAEKLVAAALSRGVPGRVFRPGYVSGHTRTGVSSLDDNRLAFLKVCMESGVAPSIDANVDMAPVDFAAAAIVAISKTEESLGKVINIYNPNIVAWGTIVEWLVASGYKVEVASREEWARRTNEFAAGCDKSYMFLPFQAELEVGWLTGRAPVVDCTNLLEGLSATGIEIPQFDLPLLQTYIAYLVKEKFLLPPS